MTEEDFSSKKDPFVESGRPIPPVDGAWSLMRKKLDARLPVTLPRIYSQAAWWSGAAAAVIVTIIVLVFLVSRPANPHQAITHQVPSKDSINITNATPAALIPAAPAPATLAGSADKTSSPTVEKTAQSFQPEKDPISTSINRSTGSSASGSAGRESVRGNRWGKVREASKVGSVTVKRSAHTRSPLHIERLTHALFYQISDSLLRASALKGQKAITPINLAKKTKSWRDPLRMSAGISAGKAFPIDGQDAYAFNSSGQKAGLEDYIPHVYFRYYPGKNNYIQAELAIHSPQYTRSPFIDSSYLGTSTLPGWRSDPEYFTIPVKKLYYNDLGLSFHQRLFDELSVGAGIQFSHLTDAVAQKDTVVFASMSGGRDTVLGSQIFGLQGIGGEYNDMPKNDWRITLQAEYFWRRWMLSVVFKEAIHTYTDFFHVGYIDHYRNSSLSVYLSYDLWERKRKK